MTDSTGFPGTMILAAVPNRDFPAGRRGPRIAPRVVAVASVDEARRTLRDFVTSYDLGGGNMTSETGRVFDGVTETPIGRVAYNGRWIRAEDDR